MNLLASFKNWLNGTTDGRVLGLFRIVFGLFMTYYCLYYHQAQFIKQGLMAPAMHFKYEGFEWVGLLPEPAMRGILFAMGIAALLMTIGIWMKPATLFYAIGLSYFTLAEKAYYNNHIYLFILLCVLLAFTDADRFFSARGNRNYGPVIPRWQIFLLQLQVCMVYFYGGLAKLSPDWLFRQEPMRTMVTKYMGYDSVAAAYFLNYAGLLIDLGAPLLLFYKPLRKWGVAAYMFFNLSNSQLFDDIGIFPFVMLTALLLYFETHELPWLRNFTGSAGFFQEPAPNGKRAKKSTQPSVSALVPTGPAPLAPWLKWTLLAYWTFQCFFPFRGFFLPNPMDYTTIGNRFSWRMKIDTRTPEEVAYFVRLAKTGEERQLKIETYLNPMQIKLLTMDPRAAADFAHYLRDKGEKVSGVPPKIRAQIKFAYNGRPAQYFVDSQIDLSTVQHTPYQKLDWVLPLK